MSSEQPTQPWYTQTWAIVLALWLFFPLGLYLMWRFARWQTWIRTTITVAGSLLTILFIVGAAIGEEDDTAKAVRQEASPSPAVEAPSPTVEPTKTPKPTATVKPTSTTVPPTATPVPLDQRPEAEAIRQTIHGYFDAYNNAVENDSAHPFIAILRYVDSRADGECGGIVAHGFAYIQMKQYMRERWEIGSIFDNEYDELDAKKGTAWVSVQMASFDIDTGEPVVPKWDLVGYHFKTDSLSPTGWVFTATDDCRIDLHYADGHDGPAYDPLAEVVSFCSRD